MGIRGGMLLFQSLCAIDLLRPLDVVVVSAVVDVV